MSRPSTPAPAVPAPAVSTPAVSAPAVPAPAMSAPAMSTTDRLVCAALAASLLALAWGGLEFRRRFIRSLFAPGPGGAAPPALALPDPMPEPAGLDRAARVRVVLIDGLSRGAARSMRHLDAICRGGYDLVVDAGFPTVSLPVQYALWTGLTQQQSGVLFRGKPQVVNHPMPPPPGIPGQIADSVAVAESHPFIVRALGFARALPTMPDRAADPSAPGDPDAMPAGWPGTPPGGPFARAAREVVAGDAALAFVHVLAVDEAGHKRGAASAAYAEAVRQADSLLGALYLADATRPGPPARWFVLSDHGHRPAGGHGGGEPAIRRVRACIAGALPANAPPPPPGAYLHMIDVARAIADSTGTALAPGSAGRPLFAAARAPVSRDATLPAPSRGQWLLAALIVAALAAITFAAAVPRAGSGSARRTDWLALPWWWVIAFASVLALEARATMSAPMVYQGSGARVFTAAWPGLLVLAASIWVSLGRRGAVRAAAGQLALPAAMLGAALALAGGVPWLSTAPPLMPFWTAHASAFAVLAAAGAFVAGLVLAGASLAAPGPPGPRPRETAS